MGSRRGQIIIPAIFIFPSLVLFVFLIYETAKLSREKIRHQFAVDAAAFVEMTNYSDFLNRTAYVNGAFPMRIFEEGFKDVMIPCEKKKNCSGDRALSEIMYASGVYPRTSQSESELRGSATQWRIQYGGPRGQRKNGSPTQPPDMPGSEINGIFPVISQDDVHDWWINWDDSNHTYKIYVQVYALLGSVEEAQFSVLKRLTSDHNFYKKSYWLNTGDDITEAESGKISFRSNASGFVPSVKFYCHHKLTFYGNKATNSTFQPWQEWAPENPIPMNYMQSCEGGPGIFQVAWIPKGELDKMRTKNSGNDYPGYLVEHSWTAPQNYFNMNFNGAPELNNRKPYVRSTVSVGVNNPSAAVWPNPTPKFQVRTYP